MYIIYIKNKNVYRGPFDTFNEAFLELQHEMGEKLEGDRIIEVEKPRWIINYPDFEIQ
jgi:hypothetical protein